MDWGDRRGVIQFVFIFAVVAGVIGNAILIGVPVVILLTNKDRTVVTPDAGACDCPDVLMMVNRLAQVNAAIQSIDGLSKAQAAKDAKAGSPEMYTDDLYAPGKAANQKAVEKVAKGDPTGAGDTPHRNCSPDVSAGRTKCMRAALQAHENVHQRECLAFDSRFGNYKEAKTMVDFWKEDREGYQAEANYLDPKIKQLSNDPKCKVKVTTYPGAESKEEQKERLAGSRRRVSAYVKAIS